MRILIDNQIHQGNGFVQFWLTEIEDENEVFESFMKGDPVIKVEATVNRDSVSEYPGHPLHGKRIYFIPREKIVLFQQ